MSTKQTTTWYMARWERIHEVQVVKKLPKSLVILHRQFYLNGRDKVVEKTVRDSSYEKYFPTYDEAKNYILDGMKAKIKSLEEELEHARNELLNHKL
jgi:hypothetical protein